MRAANPDERVAPVSMSEPDRRFRLSKQRHIRRERDRRRTSRRRDKSRQLRHHQRSNALPQVKPPPMASSITSWPGRIRPSAQAVARASGMEAAEVLA